MGTRIASVSSMSRPHRVIAVLASFAALDFTLGSLVQTGVIRRLPDPPWRPFDSRAVMMSDAAWPRRIPDAPIALALQAAILALVGAARDARPARRRTIGRLLATASLAGALGAARYLIEMVRQRRVCIYCIAAASAMVAIAPLALVAARERA